MSAGPNSQVPRWMAFFLVHMCKTRPEGLQAQEIRTSSLQVASKLEKYAHPALQCHPKRHQTQEIRTSSAPRGLQTRKTRPSYAQRQPCIGFLCTALALHRISMHSAGSASDSYA